MLSKKMEKALNEQIVKELYSAYLYQGMAAYFESRTLKGLASWMKVQVQEELSHAQIFFNYICEAGGKVSLAGIDGVKTDYKGVADVFQATLKHEQGVSASIGRLMDLAISLKDHATKQFLEWFVKEQVEEEASAGEMLDQARRVGKGEALYLFDKDAGVRTFTLPTPLAPKGA